MIPVLNERSRLEIALGPTVRPGVERIVVDGGSEDGGAEAARSLGVERLLVSQPGRARQLETGFRAAEGEVVLFLHADTRLDPGWDSELRRALVDPEVAGGVFDLRFDSDRSVYRWIERGVRLRSRVLRLPYGDQGIFVRRKLLDAIGGIPETPMFEDLDLVRAIRRAGRFVFLRTGAWTSPRRYERNGVVRTIARNGLALGAYLIGLDRERVARWYRRRPDR
ncbi:MAG: TIGR04283 family arsenosugar biosynthesis glycosyltransferase [Myxococcota bacterium]